MLSTVKDPYPSDWGRRLDDCAEVRLAPEVVRALLRLRPPWEALSLLCLETWRPLAADLPIRARSRAIPAASVESPAGRAGLALVCFEGAGARGRVGPGHALAAWARVAARAAGAAGLEDAPSWAVAAVRVPAGAASLRRRAA